jgi:hypothetical protein
MARSSPKRVYHEIPDNYPDRFLDCRVDRHAWIRPQLIEPGLQVPYGWPVYRECQKCGAFWARAYNRMLTEKIYERRLYPEGYLLKGVGMADTRPKHIQYVRLMIERENTEFIFPNNS